MDQGTTELLFTLLRSAIRGNELTNEEKQFFSDELVQKILQIAKRHDVEHLVAFALKKNGLLKDKNEKIENSMLKAVFRYRQLNYEYQSICDALESAKIPFIPLKGSVMRKYYPEGWMRTSCDIDILVHEEDTEKAKSILVNEYDYTYRGKSSHDLSFFSPNNIHVELHYSLVEDGLANESFEVLKSVWNTAIHRDGFEFCYDMPDEMFYFYHVAHMAKHFENGGCGIRPLIDLWILDNLNNCDLSKRDKLLENGGLLKFADASRKLSKVWLVGKEPDNLLSQMEKYILYGGVYGNTENRVAVQQQKRGGKFKYAISRIFIPYEEIKFHYPVLHKHKWLTPIMQVRRWLKLLFFGGVKRSVNELKYNSAITKNEANETNILLTKIGLK